MKKRRGIEDTIIGAAEATMIRATVQESAQDVTTVQESENEDENDEYLVPDVGEKTVNTHDATINKREFPESKFHAR